MKMGFLVAMTAITVAPVADAVEIHPSEWGDTVRYVHTQRVQYYSVPQVRVVSYSVPDPDVDVDVDVDLDIDVDDPDDDWTESLSMIEVGAGFGGFYMPSLRESLLTAPRAHLGLIIDPVSVNLDISVCADLEWGPIDAGGACIGVCDTGDLVQASLGFGWRWNRSGVLHPTAGAGLELASLDPDLGDDSFAFTAAVMAGLIFEYPLPSGALEIGLDTTAHVKIAAQDAYPLEDRMYLTFGGYAGYRF